MLPIAILSCRVERCACVFDEEAEVDDALDRLYVEEDASERPTFTCFYPAAGALTCEKFDSADRVVGCLHETMAACVYTSTHRYTHPPYTHAHIHTHIPVIHDRVRVNVSFYNASAVMLQCTSVSF